MPWAFSLLKGYARLAPTERGGFRLARLARRTLPRERWRGVFDAGGPRLDLDLATYPDVAMAAGLYELDTLRTLRRLLRPGMTFVDGGANLGFFTHHAAARVGSGGRVVAVEPDPVNRERLTTNLRRNGLEDRVQVEPVALAEAAGTATFHRPTADAKQNHGESGRFPAPGQASESFDVTLTRLDGLLPEPPDVVKLDLEGSEVLAVRGATGWAERPPTWIIEHSPPAAERAGHRPSDVWRALREIDPSYRCRVIATRGREMTSDEDVDTFARQVNLLYETR